ncbi:hypothetical protein AAC387_Pa07g0504 [Persea americana]
MLVSAGDGEIPVEGGEPATTRVLEAISCVLERLVTRNERVVSSPDSVRNSGKGLSVFQGVRAPSISISKYLERIFKYTSCSPSCFVVGYIYMDRLVHRHPDSLVGSLNVHRLVLTSVMVASKVLDDEHYNNAFYARVGGISNSELNRLELELLFLLDFSVVVSSRVFESYCLHLEKEMMWNGINQRIDRNMSSSTGEETEISVGDTMQSSSPNAID